ncbi:hypothetical protein ACTFTM_23695 [Micromonospora sp. RB23]
MSGVRREHGGPLGVPRADALRQGRGVARRYEGVAWRRHHARVLGVLAAAVPR